MSLSFTRRLFALLLVAVLVLAARVATWARPGGSPVIGPPVATADHRSTTVNTPISLPLLANDHAVAAALDPTSVNLDPAGAYPANVVVTPTGTFAVDAAGVLTFTPAAGFRGTAHLTYCVRDLSGQMSAPTAVTIRVAPAVVVAKH